MLMASGMWETLGNVMESIPWYAWIPIVAIIVGGVSSIIKLSHKHRERMEMIRHGIDPRKPGE